jgi:hypothetical protein
LIAIRPSTCRHQKPAEKTKVDSFEGPDIECWLVGN